MSKSDQEHPVTSIHNAFEAASETDAGRDYSQGWKMLSGLVIGMAIFICYLLYANNVIALWVVISVAAFGLVIGLILDRILSRTKTEAREAK